MTNNLEDIQEDTKVDEGENNSEELSKKNIEEIMKVHFKELPKGQKIVVQDSYMTKNKLGEDIIIVKYVIQDSNKMIVGGSLEGGKSVIILSKDGKRCHSTGDISEEEQKKVATKFDLPRGVISLIN